MKRLTLLAAMLAIVVMTAMAAPAMAQDNKAARQAQKAAKVEAKAAKAGEKNKMQEMPKTGGVAVDASLLGLGAGALLVGGGLVVRRVTR